MSELTKKGLAVSLKKFPSKKEITKITNTKKKREM